MQLVQQPTHKLDRITLSGDLEPPSTRQRHLLQELMRRHLSFKQLRVPHFPRQLCEPLDELGGFRFGFEGLVVWVEEEVSKGRNVKEGVNDDVEVVVGFDVVETDVAWEVRVGGEIVGGVGEVGETSDLGRGETRIKDVDDVGERGIRDFVTVGEDVEL